MDEAEWLSCDDPSRMVLWLKRLMSPRKFRLFVCACCRSLWDELTTEPTRKAVEALERYADGQAAAHDLEQARGVAEEEVARLWSLVEGMSGGWTGSLSAQSSVLWAATRSAFRVQIEPEQWAQSWHADRERQSRLLRDVFGNPFRRVTLDVVLRTPAVLALAHASYDNRLLPAGHLEPDRLAVLADALEEAGCTDPELLGHLREPGPHVRGCWPVDLLVGKRRQARS